MANAYELPPRNEIKVKPKNGIVQPPTIPPPERPGRNTNQLVFLLEKVLNAIWNHKLTESFREPVDAKKLKLPNYHKKIKWPMDLGTIKKRLENQYYCSSSEAIDDFKKIFENCYSYNHPGSEVIVIAKKLEKMFNTKIAQMPKDEVSQKVDRRKTVHFAPDVDIDTDDGLTYPYTPTPAKLRKEEKSIETTSLTEIAPKNSEKVLPIEPVTKKSKERRKTVALTKLQNTTLSADAISETTTEPAAKIRRKTIASKKNKTDTLVEAKTSGETISETSKELPARTESKTPKGRRKTIALKKSSQNVTDKLTETENTPEDSNELPVEREPLTQTTKERKKNVAPKKSRKKAEAIPTTIESVCNETNEKTTKSPIESVAHKAKERKQMKKSRKEAAEKFPEITTSIEVSNEMVENSKEIQSNGMGNDQNNTIAEAISSIECTENGPNEHQQLVQPDKLSEGEANDSGVDSIPEDAYIMKIRSLEDQLQKIQSDIQKLKENAKVNNKRMNACDMAYSNGNYLWHQSLMYVTFIAFIFYNYLSLPAPPSKRARRNAISTYKEEILDEIVIESSESDTRIESNISICTMEELQKLNDIIPNLPGKLLFIITLITSHTSHYSHILIDCFRFICSRNNA